MSQLHEPALHRDPLTGQWRALLGAKEHRYGFLKRKSRTLLHIVTTDRSWGRYLCGFPIKPGEIREGTPFSTLSLAEIRGEEPSVVAEALCPNCRTGVILREEPSPRWLA